MEIGEILDRAKSANGIKTDMALANALGVGRAAVSAWRHGQRLPDPVQCATLAGLSGMPLAQVMGIVGEARAISREEKAVWRKLAGSVALLLCAIGLAGGVSPKALAHKGYAEKSQDSAAAECLLCQFADWGWWAWLLRQWLAWRLRGSKPSNGSLDACQIA